MSNEQSSVDIQKLIGLERIEKFDLLGQLILNQREALILCGPDGIGKTTLLKTLKQNREHLWTICFLQSTVQFSFDYIKKQLALSIKEQGAIPYNDNVHDMLHFYEEHQQKVVLILDNAGSLAAGLINKLIEYSLEFPAIRIIFALTKDELVLKNSEDTAIDDCYFIDIPPLDKEQVSVFLQTLSKQPEALITVDEINDKTVKNLYQQTDGVPGRIVDKLQRDGSRSPQLQKKRLLGSFLMGSFALAYFYKPMPLQNLLPAQLFEYTSEASPSIARQSTPDLTLSADVVPDNKKLVLSDLSEVPKVEKLVIQKPLEKNKSTEVKKKLVAIESSSTDTNIEKKPKPIIKDNSEGKGNKQWLLQQPPQNYTLQLMVVPSLAGLESVLKQHITLQDSLKYIQVLRKNKQKYILLYGSFESSQVAQKVLKTLPKAFKGAWPKSFAAMQKEVK